MKKAILFLTMTLFVAATAMAQTSGDDARKVAKEKADKWARKEAKRLKKEGWLTTPGSLPMDKQLQDAGTKLNTTDEKGNVAFITADGNAVAENKTAAEMQAIEMGKLQLGGLIETNINSLISGNIANAQLSTTDAASVTEVVQSSKNLIAMELGYVNPVVKLYRDIPGNKVEVQVKLFYDVKQSLEVAKKVVRKELKDKLKLNEEKLEKLMGIN